MEAYDSDSSNYEEMENYKRWREKYWRSDYLVALISFQPLCRFRPSCQDSRPTMS